MKTSLLAIFTFCATCAIGAWAFAVPLNAATVGFWFAWLIVPGVLAGLVVLGSTDSGGERGESFGYIGAVVAMFSVGTGLLGLVACAVASAHLFHAMAYRDQILNHSTPPAQARIVLPDLNVNDAPLVSSDMAARIAGKLIARDGQIGSSFSVAGLRKQIVDGRLAWVGYLDFNSIFAWSKYGAAPGYVIVSATDPNDARLVTRLDGKPLAMRWLDGAWFDAKATRWLWLHGSMRELIGEPVPQLGPGGRPYLVAPIVKKTIGAMGGSEAVGTFVLDTQTGAIRRYNLANTPLWVSRIQPQDFVATQVDNAGDYVNGWLNPSNAGRFAGDGSPELVYGNNGRLYWYEGLTSVGNDDGVIGYYLVDARTKQVTRYDVTGVSMEAVQKAAEGKIPQYHYTATMPLPFNVNGVPTYIMAMRDETGIARDYAMVDMHNYQVLAVDDTLDGALSDYATALVQAGETLTGKAAAAGTAATTVSLEGTLARAALLVHHGDTSLVWLVQGRNGKGVAVVGDAMTFGNLAALARSGDAVSITYRKNLAGQTAILITAHDLTVEQAATH